MRISTFQPRNVLYPPDFTILVLFDAALDQCKYIIVRHASVNK